MANIETARLAELIDANNASGRMVKELLEEVARYGTATVKCAYGDWTTVLATVAGDNDLFRLRAPSRSLDFASEGSTRRTALDL